jgi:hypothetical protein
VNGFGMAQQPFQIAAPNHGFNGRSGRGVFVHDGALLQTLIRKRWFRNRRTLILCMVYIYLIDF